MTKKFTLSDTDETKQLGSRLAQRISGKPVIIFLRGDLGTGKTTLAQGFIASLVGNDVHIQSPTFAYMHRYHHTTAIYHFDLYRLEDPEQIFELGLLSLLEDHTAIRIVEWPERLGGLIAPDVDVYLTPTGPMRTAAVNFLTLI